MQVILASKSPRRQELLKHIISNFEIEVKEIEEVFPATMSKVKVPEYLAELKGDAFKENLKPNQLIITSDTVVVLNDFIYGKPKDRDDALRILTILSGNVHQVITGVSILTANKKYTFSNTTNVHFKKLTFEQISYYVDNFHPYDKAGAYAIQEWIGMVGIEKIDGCYFNVMGLPLSKLYETLQIEFPEILIQ